MKYGSILLLFVAACSIVISALLLINHNDKPVAIAVAPVLIAFSIAILRALNKK